MENDNTVLLNPPLFALDKDAPLHYAGNADRHEQNVELEEKPGWGHSLRWELMNVFTGNVSSNQLLLWPI